MKLTNVVKDAAASGNRIRGIHLTFAAPAVIEVLAAIDLQFVYIDGEHGRFDWADIEAACIAAERHRLTPIARIPDISRSTITRFLDRGVRGIVAPHIESVEAARQVVDAACFAPLGNRSYGAGRPQYRPPSSCSTPSSSRSRPGCSRSRASAAAERCLAAR